MNSSQLTGRWSLVTGAAGFLGREHSFALAEIGSNLVITDIDEKRLQKLKKELEQEFQKIEIQTRYMDVTKEECVQNVFDELTNEDKYIDVLINNAAIDPKVTKDERSLSSDTRLENFSIERWDSEISVGLTGALICSKIFGTDMAKRKKGSIINISSELSINSPDQRIYKKEGLRESEQPVKPVTYSVIKHALTGLTKYLATYWAKENVRVNAISPGSVINNHPEDFVELIKQRVPMNRMANKEELRGTIQYLSTDASSFMTGQNIIVDGGRSLW